MLQEMALEETQYTVRPADADVTAWWYALWPVGEIHALAASSDTTVWGFVHVCLNYLYEQHD